MYVWKTQKFHFGSRGAGLHQGPEYFLFHSHLLTKLGAVATHFGLAINQLQDNISFWFIFPWSACSPSLSSLWPLSLALPALHLTGPVASGPSHPPCSAGTLVLRLLTLLAVLLPELPLSLSLFLPHSSHNLFLTHDYDLAFFLTLTCSLSSSPLSLPLALPFLLCVCVCVCVCVFWKPESYP